MPGRHDCLRENCLQMSAIDTTSPSNSGLSIPAVVTFNLYTIKKSQNSCDTAKEVAMIFAPYRAELADSLSLATNFLFLIIR